jgi:3alpha(or 20beta)-hydroxysteroid dehydrogenase
MASALADAGASVMIADLLDEEGRHTAEQISKSGVAAGFVHLDVRDDAAWAAR